MTIFSIVPYNLQIVSHLQSQNCHTGGSKWSIILYCITKGEPASGPRVHKDKGQISVWVVTQECIKTLANNCTLQTNKFTTDEDKPMELSFLTPTTNCHSTRPIHKNSKDAIKVPVVNLTTRICFATLQKKLCRVIWPSKCNYIVDLRQKDQSVA